MGKLTFSVFRKSQKYMLLVVVLCILGGLSYYLSRYKNDLKELETKRSNEGSESGIVTEKIWQKYPSGTVFPEFVVLSYGKIPEELPLKNEYQEHYGIRVISTGKFSETTIKNPSKSEEVIKILQVEVIINDGQGYLENNKAFNVAISVLSGENLDIEVSPSWAIQIKGDNEIDKLMKSMSQNGERVLSEDDLDYIYEKSATIVEELVENGLSSDEIEEIFSANKELVIRPYIKNELFNYDLSNNRLTEDDYLVLVDKYYGGKDSVLIDKIFAKDISSVKSPVLPVTIYAEKYE